KEDVRINSDMQKRRQNFIQEFKSFHGGQVAPEMLKTFIAAKQRREYGGVCQQDFSQPFGCRGHSKKHIEFAVARLYERMWMSHINRLTRQHVNEIAIVRGYCIMRQVHVKVERIYILEQVQFVKITIDVERYQFVCAIDCRRTKTELVFYGNTQALHDRACIYSKPLLTRYEWITVMEQLHQPIFRIIGSTDVVVGS